MEMTPQEAIEKVREFLDSVGHANICEDTMRCSCGLDDATNALTIIEQNMMPELPEGWYADGIFQCTDDRKLWECELQKDDDYDGYRSNIRIGHGATMREAIQNAIKQVEK